MRLSVEAVMAGPSALYNRVLETTTTTGTGTLSLAGAVNGSCQSFNVVGDGNTCRFTVTDNLTFYEQCIGTFTLAGRTLSRTTVLESSNADALVNIPSGNTVYVFLADDANLRQKALFTGTASVTVTATGDTTLMPAGQGSVTIPEDFFTAGKTVRFKARGYLSTGVAPGNVTLNFKLGGVTVASTGAVAAVGSLTNLAWDAEVEVTCRTTGAGGTVFVQGDFEYEITAVGADIAGLVNTGATSLDTTSGQAVDFSVNWAGTGNSITLTNASLEGIN
jgi:hypothetical protein